MVCENGILLQLVEGRQKRGLHRHGPRFVAHQPMGSERRACHPACGVDARPRGISPERCRAHAVRHESEHGVAAVRKQASVFVAPAPKRMGGARLGEPVAPHRYHLTIA